MSEKHGKITCNKYKRSNPVISGYRVLLLMLLSLAVLQYYCQRSCISHDVIKIMLTRSPSYNALTDAALADATVADTRAALAT